MIESEFHDRAVTWLRIENCPDVFNNDRDYGYEETLSWLIEVQKDATKDLQQQLTAAREENLVLKGCAKHPEVWQGDSCIGCLEKQLSDSKAEVELIKQANSAANKLIEDAANEATRQALRADNAEKEIAAYIHDISVSNEKRDTAEKQVVVLREALQEFVDKYVAMINSGDCGNWNPEEEPVVVNARKAITTPTQGKD